MRMEPPLMTLRISNILDYIRSRSDLTATRVFTNAQRGKHDEIIRKLVDPEAYVPQCGSSAVARNFAKTAVT